MYINVDKLKEAILEKYRTQQKFAEAIGYAETQITRAVKTQSPRFLLACKKAGIDIDKLIFEESKSKPGNEKEMLQLAYKRIDELEKLVKQLNDIIDLYKKFHNGDTKKNK